MVCIYISVVLVQYKRDKVKTTHLHISKQDEHPPHPASQAP